jgi:hypothetical protein
MSQKQVPFETVVQMQYDLSFTLAGPNWLTDTDRVDLGSALRDEAVEAAKSAGWKPWWSKAKDATDFGNAQLEIVDKFHFLMQGLLQDQYAKIQHDLAGVTLDEEDGKLFLVRPVAQLLETTYLDNGEDAGGPVSVVSKINTFLGSYLFLGSDASLPYFWELCHSLSLNRDLLVSFYLAKNTLNYFRKAKNYKGDIEGAAPYIKMWVPETEDELGSIIDPGKEDNDVLMGYVRNAISHGDVLTAETIYATLEKLYAYYTSSVGSGSPE